MTAIEDYTLCYHHQVRYHEIDAQAVVYNAHYLSFFDIAITEYVRAAGLIFDAAPQDFDFHVAHAGIDFARPIKLDSKIDVGVRLEKIGNSSITFSLAIFDSAQAVHATGKIVWVWSDVQQGGSVPIPDKLKEQLSSLP